ncbi:hypothetical protein PAXRUDRAFT_435868 [Paxillus rubicundulus Ve08.2h10]|uniref:Uncharacterized protein n=1 Tax=Paxillus rubicundulus Ve08.2h10 TaxID=930991 RepID=A0A0D0DX98_9AGAM|nr:hypothetical protein PAXRUDRAFT_435868 [Paxillus rubicundulus Ve08.2h10]
MCSCRREGLSCRSESSELLQTAHRRNVVVEKPSVNQSLDGMRSLILPASEYRRSTMLYLDHYEADQSPKQQHAPEPFASRTDSRCHSGHEHELHRDPGLTKLAYESVLTTTDEQGTYNDMDESNPKHGGHGNVYSVHLSPYHRPFVPSELK